MSDVPEVTEQIRQAEDQRYAAMLTADIGALDSLLSGRLRYQHSTGVADGKQALLDKIGSGALTYVSLEHPVHQVTVLGDTVLVFGEMSGEVLLGGTTRQLHNSVLSVWAAEDASWKLIAFQPTPIPG